MTHARFIKDTRKAWKKARWRKKEKRMFDRFYKYISTLSDN